MPTSSSKPLITAPLSLLRTEARQPASLRSQGALLRGAPPSPGFRHACPRASAGTIPLLWQQLRLLTGPTPTPDLKGRPVNWAPLARRLVPPGSPWQVCPTGLHPARPPITTAGLPEAPAASAHALARSLPTQLLSRLLPGPGRVPEHVVMGIDAPTLAGAVQNASVTHHGTADAVPKPSPGGKQLGALGAVQKAQGGGDGCGRGTRWGAMWGAVVDHRVLFLVLNLSEA